MRPGSAPYRRRERARLLRFAAGSRVPEGFGYLDDRGAVDRGHPVELYITCRMTHVFSLGRLADEKPEAGGPGADNLRRLAEHGVAALLDGPLRDPDHDGWYASIRGGGPENSSKQAYGHAFVLLAASSAVTAGVARAEELFDAAAEVQLQRFWDEQEGMVVEEWDATWTELDDYRGLNSTMHTVEAYLAAGVATGDPSWYRRAERMARRPVAWARQNNWRFPEHFDSSWVPILDFNRDRPADPFRPYGATVGHALEWARLLINLDTALGTRDLTEPAIALADQAVGDGWAVDGADGFIYTTDWGGHPVVRERMHWVLTEAIATSVTLHGLTGDERYADQTQRWWEYADRYLIDPAGLSWRHELTPRNTPGEGTWSGRPDIYHAYQAALTAQTLGAPSFAAALASKE